jgi:hypothetical protein
MTIQEIKKLLDSGDYKKIARLVGYTDERWGSQYVSEVLNGKVTGTRGKAKAILEAAESIALRNQKEGKQLN